MVSALGDDVTAIGLFGLLRSDLTGAKAAQDDARQTIEQQRALIVELIPCMYGLGLDRERTLLDDMRDAI